jgi:hemolysin activation/secretion protein
VGALPMERNWFLGDSHTIRGQTPSPLQSGNAFWRGRVEVGTLIQGARPVLFTDIGWVGDRTAIRNAGRPMSGVGAGASLLDGLLRFDVSRGLYPLKQWRVDFYLDAIF